MWACCSSGSVIVSAYQVLMQSSSGTSAKE
jgi:hypothetical protein